MIYGIRLSMECLSSRRAFSLPSAFVCGAILVGCQFLPASFAQEVRPEALEHFRAAQQDQRAGRLSEAAAEYEKGIRLEPGISEVYANLGLVYYAEARFEESARALATADKLKPGLLVANLWLGVDLVNLNQPLKALPYLRKAISINPQDQQAERWLGTALWNADQAFAALEQFHRAHELFPQDADILFVMGEAYRKAADKEFDTILAHASGAPLLNQMYGDRYRESADDTKSIAQYNLAIQKDKSYRDAYRGLGDIYLRQGMLPEAEKAFQALLGIDSSSVAALTGLAEVELCRGNNENAVAYLDRAIHLSPAEVSAAFARSPSPLSADRGATEQRTSSSDQGALQKAQAGLQQMPETASRNLALYITDFKLNSPAADADWQAFVQLAPRQSLRAGTLEAAQSDYDSQNYTAAMTGLHRWLELHPADLEARYLLARTLRSLSLLTLGELLKQAPEAPRAHQLQAQIFESRGENQKALQEISRVVEIDPSLPGVNFELAHLLWQSGDSDKAMEALNRELKINPNNAEANGEVGSILVEQHKPTEAIPFLRAALQTHADRGFLHQELGKAYSMIKQYPQSEQELRKAALTDTDGSAHYQLGVLYRAEGQSKAAAQAFAASEAIKADRLTDIKLVPSSPQ